MKFRDLVRRLDEEGCVLVRHGASHHWYRNVITGVLEAVPRHREINIIRHLSAPSAQE